MTKRGRPPYPDVLTPRQFEVLELLREGGTNREIAERLDITSDAVKFHVSEILGRLGVTSRIEAAQSDVAPTPEAMLHHAAAIPSWREARRPARLPVHPGAQQAAPLQQRAQAQQAAPRRRKNVRPLAIGPRAISRKLAA